MRDFIEIDFIEAGDRSSGDAITIRHRRKGIDCVHVVDGGYQADGQKLVDHIREHYGCQSSIDHLVLTHPDADHASGIETVIRKMMVKRLWMNIPWWYVDNLLPRFKHYQDRERLIARLKSAFSKGRRTGSSSVIQGHSDFQRFLGRQDWGVHCTVSFHGSISKSHRKIREDA